MEYWRCGKADERKRGQSLMSEIEGKEILPGTSFQNSCVLWSYHVIASRNQKFQLNPYARVTTPRTATITAVTNIKDIVDWEKEMI